MATFQTRVEDLVGSCSAMTGSLSNWLTDAAAQLLNLIPNAILMKVASTGDGTISLVGKRILGVRYENFAVPTEDDRRFEAATGFHWTANGNHSTVARSNEQAYTGTYSLKIISTGIGDATTNYAALPSANSPTWMSGRTYTISLWIRATDGDVTFRIKAGGQTSSALTCTTLTWVNKTFTFICASSGATAIQIYFNGVETAYIDEITITEDSGLSLADPYSLTELTKREYESAFSTSSMYYRPTGQAGYYIEGGTLKLAGISSANVLIAYITYPTVTYGDSSISGFPVEYEQGIVLYVAVRARTKQLYTLINTALTLTLPTAIVDLPAAPSYTYTAASATATAADNISAFITAPVYSSPTNFPINLSAQLTTLGIYLDTNKDIELAGGKLGEIQTRLQGFVNEMQDALNVFNDANVEYQADVQKKIRQAEIDLQRVITDANNTTNVDIQNKARTLEKDISLYRDGLARHANDTQRYSAQANAVVQEYISKFNVYKQQHDAMYAELLQLRQLYDDWLLMNFGIGRKEQVQQQ